jgi:hypothetical protein
MNVSHSALRYRLHGLKLSGGDVPERDKSRKTKKESFNQGSLW